MRYQARSRWTMGSARIARSAGGGGSGPRSDGLAPTLLSIVSGCFHHVGQPACPQRVQGTHAVQPRLTSEQEAGLSPGIQMGKRCERLAEARQDIALLAELPDRVQIGAATQWQAKQL